MTQVSVPQYPPIPKQRHGAMGHRFDFDLRCSQSGCRVTWEQHQVNPQPCQGKPAVQRTPVAGAEGLSRLCQMYAVFHTDIAAIADVSKHRVWRHFKGFCKPSADDACIDEAARELLMARGVDVDRELGAM